jgi:hypothetical protein
VRVFWDVAKEKRREHIQTGWRFPPSVEPTPAGTLEVGAQHGAVWGPIFCLSDEI